MRLIILFLLSITSTIGCAASTYNIIDITDDQYIENAQGNRCIEKEMIITPDAITYLYENCLIRRVVKPHPHILPIPKPRCDKLQCSP